MIDIINDRLETRASYDTAAESGDELVTSSIAAHELIFGCLISPRPELHLARAREFLTDLRIEAFTEDGVMATASIRRDLRRAGTPIGASELIIAGQALKRGWAVVTRNLDEFTRVDGQAVPDWFSPQDLE